MMNHRARASWTAALSSIALATACTFAPDDGADSAGEALKPICKEGHACGGGGGGGGGGPLLGAIVNNISDPGPVGTIDVDISNAYVTSLGVTSADVAGRRIEGVLIGPDSAKSGVATLTASTHRAGYYNVTFVGGGRYGASPPWRSGSYTLQLVRDAQTVLAKAVTKVSVNAAQPYSTLAQPVSPDQALNLVFVYDIGSAETSPARVVNQILTRDSSDRATLNIAAQDPVYDAYKSHINAYLVFAPIACKSGDALSDAPDFPLIDCNDRLMDAALQELRSVAGVDKSRVQLLGVGPPDLRSHAHGRTTIAPIMLEGIRAAFPMIIGGPFLALPTAIMGAQLFDSLADGTWGAYDPTNASAMVKLRQVYLASNQISYALGHELGHSIGGELDYYMIEPDCATNPETHWPGRMCTPRQSFTEGTPPSTLSRDRALMVTAFNTAICDNDVEASNVYPNPWSSGSGYQPYVKVQVRPTNSNAINPCYATFEVWNELGQKVRVLSSNVPLRGYSAFGKEGPDNANYIFKWDMKSSAGVPVASGRYFFRVRMRNMVTHSSSGNELESVIVR